jgi:hypothetical protein
MSLPTLTVEIAFRTDPDDPEPQWDDVSEHVKTFKRTSGRQHELDSVQAGTLTLKLDNGNRRFDPTYTHSPYYPYVLPMRRIRLSLIWDSVTYRRFDGFIERWPIEWEAPKWGSVTVTATDGMAALAQADIAGSFPEELSGARIARVLSAADWPESTPSPSGYWTLGTSQLGTTTILSYGAPDTVIDSGWSRVAAASFDEGGGTSALSHIQEVAAAERGMFFIDGEGRAVFHDRRQRYAQTSVVTFTDDLASLDADRLKYQGLNPEFDSEQVRNEVIVTRPGGTAQTATDGESRTRYRRRTLPLSLPLTTDQDAQNRAAFELKLRKDPRLEWDSLEVKPRAQSAAWPHVLGLELGDMVAIEREPDSTEAITAEIIERSAFVEAIEEEGGRRDWVTRLQLSPAADLYDQFFTLGVSQLDSEETAILAY